jgi:hypothetical protein
VFAELLGIHTCVGAGIPVVWLNDIDSHSKPLPAAHNNGQPKRIAVIDDGVPVRADTGLPDQTIRPFRIAAGARFYFDAASLCCKVEQQTVCSRDTCAGFFGHSDSFAAIAADLIDWEGLLTVVLD